jgi:hypothetical protein
MASDRPKKDEAPVHLEAGDGDRPVVIALETQDRLLRTCQWAVEACKLGLGRETLLRELDSLVHYLRKWAKANSAMISDCFATPREEQIGIYVIPKTAKYDFDLSDKLTKLDLELSEKFRTVPCDVLQVPPLEAERISFLKDKGLMIPLHGDEIGTPETVGA